jgi:hypothetical protein
MMSQPVLSTKTTKSALVSSSLPQPHLSVRRQKKYDRRSGAVAVEKLTIVDAGTLVHPDGALARLVAVNVRALGESAGRSVTRFCPCARPCTHIVWHWCYPLFVDRLRYAKFANTCPHLLTHSGSAALAIEKPNDHGECEVADFTKTNLC